MKVKTKVLYSAVLSAAILFGGVSVTQANAGVFTNVSVTDIPGGGNCKVDSAHGNYRYDGFYRITNAKATYVSAWLGASGRVIDGSQNLITPSSGLPQGEAQLLNMNMVDQVYPGYYYMRFCSNGVEWGNSNDVSGNFNTNWGN